MSTYQVKDAGDPRKYFTQIPNMVDDMDLSFYAFRLYFHLKRVAGDEGTCWQSTTTLARACKMSPGKVSAVKDELVKSGLIKIDYVDNPHGGRDFHHITILDIWTQNTSNFTYFITETATSSPDELASSLHEGATSRDELASSPHELKNNPIKNNPIKNKGTSGGKKRRQKGEGEPQELEPSTPGGRVLFASLQREAQAIGRNGPMRFETITQRDRFLEAEGKLTPEELKKVIASALTAGITQRGRMVNYVYASAFPKPGNNNYRPPSGNGNHAPIKGI